ncbi:MAG: TM2 domain-containing protein [Papillibacter sp.]|jgi:ribosomal protein L40E|nr:TM2 domain-containing protein [Papillibacter sp.]
MDDNIGSTNGTVQNYKFCKFCGSKVAIDAVVCIHCGRQIEELRQSSPQYNQQPNIVINNSNVNTNNNINTPGVYAGKQKNKWIALILCFFVGYLGVHKFYEGKIGMGILYLLTAGICGIGVIIDFFVILFKPNPYYV